MDCDGSANGVIWKLISIGDKNLTGEKHLGSWLYEILNESNIKWIEEKKTFALLSIDKSRFYQKKNTTTFQP